MSDIDRDAGRQPKELTALESAKRAGMFAAVTLAGGGTAVLTVALSGPVPETIGLAAGTVTAGVGITGTIVNICRTVRNLTKSQPKLRR